MSSGKWFSRQISAPNFPSKLNSILFKYTDQKNLSRYIFTSNDFKNDANHLTDDNFAVINPYNNDHYVCLKFTDFIYVTL